jgi:hypothetical protein
MNFIKQLQELGNMIAEGIVTNPTLVWDPDENEES